MSKQNTFNFEDMMPEPMIGTIIGDTAQSVEGDSRLKVNYSSMRVVPLRRMAMFPYISVPLPIGREGTRTIVAEALENHEALFFVAQKDADIELPDPEDLYRIGVIGKIIKVLDMPDGTQTALVQAGPRAEVKFFHGRWPDMIASLSPLNDEMPEDDDMESYALMAAVEEIFTKMLNSINEANSREMLFSLKQQDSPVKRFYFICLNAPVQLEGKIDVLAAPTFKGSLTRMAQLLDQSLQLIQLKNEVASRTHEEISNQQKEHFLQAQIRAIKSELGEDSDDDYTDFLRRAEEHDWDEPVKAHFLKELRKLSHFNPSSPDYSTQYTYLDHFVNLPWTRYSTEEIDIPTVEKELDTQHYGLEKVKERIIEHIAVLKLRGDMKSPILCLVGPPGVGKTSLGKSIADALGREYARVSLGGLHDEAEIRGHRRTYIGAMPGRILSALAKCEQGNPVFVLDEIDKIGQDFKGDPAQALLEVLDPEQNSKFHDNYIDFDYDLSKIFFIATANTLSTISAPLLDRMEIIDISGYVTAEKTEIALRHLIPRSLENHGFAPEEVSFQRQALVYLIDSYTRESGVRLLEKTIAKVLRKLAVKKARGEEFETVITKESVIALLGKENVLPDVIDKEPSLGVVTGLAWTSVGGEILFIETSLAEGKGQSVVTGNLGQVMKESASIAHQWLRANAAHYDIDPDIFSATDVHIHVPEGAIPKDGPSAGITMITSLTSAYTGRKVRPLIAMTGEVTLRGKVLPVGGVREKILAARRAGVTDIILSADNRKDIEEIPAEYLEGLSFHYVRDVNEVLDFALLPLEGEKPFAHLKKKENPA